MSHFRQLVRVVSLVALAAIMVSCAPSRAATQAPSPSRLRFSILAADDHGAVTYDSRDSSYSGWSRNGTVLWTLDNTQIGARTQVSCVSRCPDAIFSSGDNQAGSPPPLHVGNNGITKVIAAPVGIVDIVSARSLTDFTAVITNNDGTELTSVHDGRPSTGIGLSSAGVKWFENRAGTQAIALAPSQPPDGGKVLQLTKTNEDWRLLATRDESSMPVGACLAADASPAVLLNGQNSLLFADRKSTVLRTDISDAADCAIGPVGAVVTRHAINSRQERETAVRGFDFSGNQAWSRDVAKEVLVTADPLHPRYALSYPDHFEIVNDKGVTVLNRRDAAAAEFTSDGVLVTMSNNKKLAWDVDQCCP